MSKHLWVLKKISGVFSSPTFYRIGIFPLVPVFGWPKIIIFVLRRIKISHHSHCDLGSTDPLQKNMKH